MDVLMMYANFSDLEKNKIKKSGKQNWYQKNLYSNVTEMNNI